MLVVHVHCVVRVVLQKETCDSWFFEKLEIFAKGMMMAEEE